MVVRDVSDVSTTARGPQTGHRLVFRVMCGGISQILRIPFDFEVRTAHTVLYMIHVPHTRYGIAEPEPDEPRRGGTLTRTYAHTNERNHSD